MKTVSEESIVKILSRNGVFVDTINKVVKINPDCTYGNGTWGKIDGLVHYHGYVMIKDRNIKKTFHTDKVKEVVKEKKELKKMKYVETQNKDSRDKKAKGSKSKRG